MRNVVVTLPPTRRGRARWALPILLGASLAAVLVLHPDSTPVALPSQDAGPADYTLIDSWSLPRPPAAPIDVALLPGGRLYVADGRRHAVLLYDASGRERGMWDHPPLPRVTSHAFVPVAVVGDPDRDRVHVLWQRNLISPKFTADGLFLDSRTAGGVPVGNLRWIGGVPPELRDAALHRPSGDLWLLSDGRAFRLRVDVGAVESVRALAPEDAGATALAVADDERLLVTRPGQHALGVYGPEEGLITIPMQAGAPVAASYQAGEGWLVLVRADNAEDPRAPLVVAVGEDGQTVTRAAASLQAPPLPGLAWPWAIDATYDGYAFSTASRRLRVQVEPAIGRRPPALVGDRAAAAWAARPAEARTGETLMIASHPDGGLVVLDGAEQRVLRVTQDGTRALLAGIGPGARDVTVDPNGTVYVSTRAGLLERLAPGDVVTPTWSSACACVLGGRVASGPGVVYVSRSGERKVAAFDPVTGARVRDIALGEGVGLWPSDVAVAGGTLYTADLVTARIQGWTQPSMPDVAWQAGLLSGPRRLAAGHGPNGSRVLAAAMADGHVELHDLDRGNLITRWQPRLLDESTVHPADIALDDDGLVYVADPGSRAIHLFGPAAGVPVTPNPRPSPSPTPSADSCRIVGNQVVSPSTVVLGSDASAEVTLSLRARCPQSARVVGADIVLVLDRSLSMRGAPIVAAREAAGAFAELLDVRHHRLGLVSFSDSSRLDVPLTDRVAAIITALDGLEPEGQTNIGSALERAREALEAGGRDEALPVIVLLTDGEHNVGSLDPVLVADAARSWGAQIYAVGLGDGVERSALQRLAGHPDHVFLAPSPDELFPIYREILRVVLESLAGNFIITDDLPTEWEYVTDSAAPPALEQAGRLRWGRSILPSTGITLTLRLRPRTVGCVPVSRHSEASYTDADGSRRVFSFPIPTVCAVQPTATPTAEPTPTPRPIYVPVVMRDHCVPRLGGADIVLLIDTSSSMSGDKIRQARGAARAFLDQLDLERDQAAVVGFSTEARIAAPLTRDARLLRVAVDGLRTESGTRIDAAMWAAVSLLGGSGRDPKNRPAIVLLSDGAHAGPSGAVLIAAGEARRLGARIYTIALGADADRDLLATIADQGRAYVAAEGGELGAIYTELATVIPCP